MNLFVFNQKVHHRLQYHPTPTAVTTLPPKQSHLRPTYNLRPLTDIWGLPDTHDLKKNGSSNIYNIPCLSTITSTVSILVKCSTTSDTCTYIPRPRTFRKREGKEKKLYLFEEKTHLLKKEVEQERTNAFSGNLVIISDLTL